MEFLICKLCGGLFRRLGPHLGPAHGISVWTYREMFPDAPTDCNDVLKAIGEASTGCSRTHSLEGCRRISEGVKLAYATDPTYTTRVSEGVRKAYERDPFLAWRVGSGNRGRTHEVSDETRRKMSEAWKSRSVDENTGRRISETLSGRTLSKEHKRAISDGMRRKWEDPEYSKKVSEGNSKASKAYWNSARSKRHRELLAELALERLGRNHSEPNMEELTLQVWLDMLFPGEWAFVGNGGVRIGNRNPDFINVNGRKAVIEMFGTYFHDEAYFEKPSEEELVAHYREYGYRCLVLWSYDIYSKKLVEERVRELVGE